MPGRGLALSGSGVVRGRRSLSRSGVVVYCVPSTRAIGTIDTAVVVVGLCRLKLQVLAGAGMFEANAVVASSS